MDERETRGGGTITAMSIFGFEIRVIFRLGLAHQPVSKEPHAVIIKTLSAVFTKREIETHQVFRALPGLCRVRDGSAGSKIRSDAERLSIRHSVFSPVSHRCNLCSPERRRSHFVTAEAPHTGKYHRPPVLIRYDWSAATTT